MEMRAFAGRQSGLGFPGLFMIAVGVIFAAIVGMKLVPAYLHSVQINQIFKTLASDPAMQNATVKEIKESFNKRANINYITEITAEDIEISKGDGELSLSANYSVRIPLAGNITLLLEFNPSSS
jgi:hypothetical protein